jgi:hypothetical protein
MACTPSTGHTPTGSASRNCGSDMFRRKTFSCAKHVQTFLGYYPQTIQYNNLFHSLYMVLGIIGNPDMTTSTQEDVRRL